MHLKINLTIVVLNDNDFLIFSFQYSGILVFNILHSNISIFRFLPNISQRDFKF
jgi:hypothetical protein